MNPFASIARFARSPMFRRGAPLAGAAAVGGVGDEFVEDVVGRHDDKVRDEAAREILGTLMDAEQQQQAMQQQQQQAYMQGADDVAAALAQGMQGADSYGGYPDMGSSEGMYSLAMAALPKTSMVAPKPKAAGPAGGVAPGPNSMTGSAPKPAGPGIHVKKASAVLGEVPMVLAEALGISKESMSPALIGGALGAGAGLAHGDSGSERLRNAIMGGAVGATGGHVVGNPATLARLKGLAGGGA